MHNYARINIITIINKFIKNNNLFNWYVEKSCAGGMPGAYPLVIIGVGIVLTEDYPGISGRGLKKGITHLKSQVIDLRLFRVKMIIDGYRFAPGVTLLPLWQFVGAIFP